MNQSTASAKLDTRFHAVYLLTSCNDKYRNYYYVGYTTNPNRRLRQHNGELGSGAWETSKRRPWRMLLFVSGFTEDRAALRFEWMWQHPDRAVAIRDDATKLKFTKLPFAIAVLYLLLRTPMFANMALSLNILDAPTVQANKGAALLAGIAEPAASPVLIIRHVAAADVDQMVCNLGDSLDDGSPNSRSLFSAAGAADSMQESSSLGGSSHGNLADFEEAGLVPCTLCGLAAAAATTFRCSASRDCLLRCHADCLAMWFYVHAPPVAGGEHAVALPTLVPLNPAPCPVCGECLHWSVLIQRLRLRMNRRETEVFEGRKAMMEQRKAVMKALEAKFRVGKKEGARRGKPDVTTSTVVSAATSVPRTPVIPSRVYTGGIPDDDMLLNM